MEIFWAKIFITMLHLGSTGCLTETLTHTNFKYLQLINTLQSFKKLLSRSLKLEILCVSPKLGSKCPTSAKWQFVPVTFF